MFALLGLLLGCPVVTDVPVGDGDYVYGYSYGDGPVLQEGLTLQIAGDVATFGYVNADGLPEVLSLGLVRVPPEQWLTFARPKNIDSYRCERAAFDVVAFDLPGVTDGPGDLPAVAHITGPTDTDAPALVADCDSEGDVLGISNATTGSAGMSNSAVFERLEAP